MRTHIAKWLCNVKVAGSDPTDGKGDFSSTLVPLNLGKKYHNTVTKATNNGPGALPGLIVCRFH